MADADDKLDFCKQALGEIGTRSTITAVDPPDGSPESYYCNLFFNSTRDQLLRAAHWGFAARSDVGLLWKALPGTPENPTIPERYTWSNRDPAPPWRYSYKIFGWGFPHDHIVQIKRVREQPQPPDTGVPLFSGYTGITNFNRTSCVPFEVATDRYDSHGNLIGTTAGIGSVAIVNAGSGYKAGDYITVAPIGEAFDVYFGRPTTVQVTSATYYGNVLTQVVVEGGTYVIWPASGAVYQYATTGVGTGFTGTPTYAMHSESGEGPTKIILTDAQYPIVDFTTSDLGVMEYDHSFSAAFSVALEGKLALALLGDKEMYKSKLQEANLVILDARVRDGNEGLTTYDHVPDWLQVRGVSAMGPSSQWFNPPYGPLFAV
jgi:hypothetical protein